MSVKTVVRTFNREKAIVGAFSEYCKNFREITLTPLDLSDSCD